MPCSPRNHPDSMWLPFSPLSHVLQMWSFPLCLMFPVHFLPFLLQKELALWTVLPLPVGRQRPKKADAPFWHQRQSLSQGSEECPSQPSLSPRALSLWLQFQLEEGRSFPLSWSAGTPSCLLPLSLTLSPLSFPPDPWTFYQGLVHRPRENKRLWIKNLVDAWCDVKWICCLARLLICTTSDLLCEFSDSHSDFSSFEFLHKSSPQYSSSAFISRVCFQALTLFTFHLNYLFVKWNLIK